MQNIALYFVRHAPVIGQDGIAYGRDAAIDETCNELFARAATQLPRDCETWIASDFPRAGRTAAILQSVLGTDRAPVINAAFNEQDFGALAGQKKTDIRNNPANRAYLADMANTAPPEGESVPQMIVRVGNALQTLTQALRDAGKERAIIVCHGGIIRSASNILNGHTFQLDMKAPHLSVHKFEIPALGL